MSSIWEKTYDRCPMCGNFLEVEVKENGYQASERCTQGCFEYSFEEGRRIK